MDRGSSWRNAPHPALRTTLSPLPRGEGKNEGGAPVFPSPRAYGEKVPRRGGWGGLPPPAGGGGGEKGGAAPPFPLPPGAWGERVPGGGGGGGLRSRARAR